MRYWRKSQKETDHWVKLGKDKLIFAFILENLDGVVWTALYWIRIGSIGGLL
jgi:hypothetical protein